MFTNRVAIVTGASRGIGSALSLELVRQGARVVACAKTLYKDPKNNYPGSLQELSHTVRQEHPGKGLEFPILLQRCDLMNYTQIRDMINFTIKKWGRIDYVINNAGALKMKPSAEYSLKDFNLVHGINVRGTFFTSTLAIPHLLQSPIETPKIINLSPPLPLDPEWYPIGGSAYTLSKHAMSSLVQAWNQEYPSLRCYSVWPETLINTAAVQSLLGKRESMKSSRTPEFVAKSIMIALEDNFTDTDKVHWTDQELFLTRYPIKDLESYQDRDTHPLPDIFHGNPKDFPTLATKN